MNAPNVSARMRFWVLLGVTSLWTLRALAEPQRPPIESQGTQRISGQARDIWLEVERAPGSEACPEVRSVFRAIETQFPERSIRRTIDPSKRDASARITIRPTSVGHEALVAVTWPRTGERAIPVDGADCRGLAEALAVTLMVFFDAEPASPPPKPKPQDPGGPASTASSEGDGIVTIPPTTPNKPKKTREEAYTESPPPRTPRRPKSVQADARASAVGGVGLLSEPALGAAVGVDLFHRSGWGLSLQGLRLWSPPAEAEDASGSVTLTLWAALFGPCYRQRVMAGSSLDLCLRLGAGSQHAEVAGFLASNSGSHAWMVLEPAIRYEQELGQILKAFASIGAVAQLRRQSFEVSLGNGTEPRTYQIASNPWVGLMAELGLAIGGSVF